MLQRIFIVFFVGLLFSSCKFFKKKEIENPMVIDTIINYKSIDTFPLFPSCDSIPSQENRKFALKLNYHNIYILRCQNIKL